MKKLYYRTVEGKKVKFTVDKYLYLLIERIQGTRANAERLIVDKLSEAKNSVQLNCLLAEWIWEVFVREWEKKAYGETAVDFFDTMEEMEEALHKANLEKQKRLN